MNKQECDILIEIKKFPGLTQRELAQKSGYSLGAVNKSLRLLMKENYLTKELQLTLQAEKFLEQAKPQNAVVLAAGFGMRMVPINTETPKGLLEVQGERLIERTIRQLKEVGVQHIYVVVGFLKEMYEYLIDDFGVELLVAADYAHKNNLHSLNRAVKHLENSYIIPCDIWCKENPYAQYEPYSWYMVTDAQNPKSMVRVNRKRELVLTSLGKGGSDMIGTAYLTGEDGRNVARHIGELCTQPRHDQDFWEAALFDTDSVTVQAKLARAEDVVEINTYEQLRELDKNSKQLKSQALQVAADALQISPEEIQHITVLKKGMTNRSFLFDVKGDKYIMRIPGDDAEKVVNHEEEIAVYHALEGLDLADDVIYIDPTSGFKVARYLENARVCDPDRVEDLQKCMAKLRQFHSLELQAEHEFDIYKKIDFYESLWQGTPSVYRDYEETKAHVQELKAYTDAHAKKKCLTHMDAVPDNFLLARDADGKEQLRLIDWEYAAMQDPVVDIAMFCIYSLYDRQQVERLIDIYFENSCQESVRTRIYCYISACGLLWSNWCEYKRNLGVEFGEYSLKQYRFAKEYYHIAKERIKRENNENC